MGSALVVVAEPVWQGSVSGGAVAVADAFGPLSFHGLVEAFDFAVPAWCVGRGDDLADLALSEQLAQAAVAGVGPGAVGHQPSAGDLALGEPRQGSLEKARDGVGFLVGEELAVGQA